MLQAVAVCVAMMAGADVRADASQAPAGGAAVQERLNRAGTELFSGTKRPGDAIPEIKAILALDPRVAEAHLLLGIAYRMEGTDELVGEAKAEFVQALALKPELVPARVYLAQLYLDLGRPGPAREVLAAGLSLSPADPQLLALAAQAERQLGHPDRAMELAKQVLASDESFAQARYYLGLALLDLRRRDEGIKELERVVQAGTRVADANLALGSAYIQAGRIPEAIEVLRQGTAIDPRQRDIRIALARAYRSSGALAKADEQLALARPKAAGTQASPFLQQQTDPDFYLELGLLRMQQGRLEAASQAFRKVLDIQPDHPEASRRLAEVRGLLQNKPRKQTAGAPR
jgi:tetratricopeptide (TPR) repeat protein